MNFLWGAATSSHQIEGHNHNDWTVWEAQGFIEGGVRSGVSSDHFNRFREDIKLAADLGLNSYRFSLEWSRFEPKEGDFRSEAGDFYAEILTECERYGLQPMVTLHHFTMPTWLAEEGGMSASSVSRWFARFVQRVAKHPHLGPRIPLFCTVNEPLVLVAGSYLGRFMPPGFYDPQRASQACANLLKCHVAAYDILKNQITERKGPWASTPLQVGFAHNMLDFRAERRYNPVERWVCREFNRLYNKAWLDAIVGRKQHFGFWGVFPFAEQVEEARHRVTADFIGVNYYTRGIVQWRPHVRTHEMDSRIPIGLAFTRRKDRVSDLGWAFHPKGLRRVLRQVQLYGLPIYITENGIADRQDRLRSEFLWKHLLVLAEMCQQGLDIRGYYHWSLIDNFEWIKGFWPRFGLYRVDYTTLERIPTSASVFYRHIIKTHGVCGPDIELLKEHCLPPLENV